MSTRPMPKHRTPCGGALVRSAAVALAVVAGAPALAVPRAPAGPARAPRAPASAPAARSAEPVTPPRAVFARLGSPAIATVSWLGPRDAPGFEVLRDGQVLASLPNGTTSFTEGGLRLGTKYCYAVRALGEGGGRSEPVTACVSTSTADQLFPDELAAPRLPAPFDVVASAGGRDRVTLRWSRSISAAGAVSYEVLKGDAAVATGVRELTATIGHLASATVHCFTVRARDSAGNVSAPSAEACAETPDVTPPSAPGGLTLAASSSSQVTLSWKAATDDRGVVRYEVRRGEARVAEPTELAWRDEGLSGGQRACYTVRAYDAAGNASAPAGPECVTTPVGVPAAPVAVAATSEEETVVRVRWSRPPGDVAVVGYDLVVEDRTVASVFEPAPDVPDVGGEARGLQPGRRYCVTVRARSDAGTLSAPSEAACAMTRDLTPPTPPPELAARATSDRKVELAWAAAPDNVATIGYEVTREGKTVASLQGTATAESDLHPGARYCYEVVALDAAGNRSRPASACATTPDLTPPTPPTSVTAVAPLTNTVEVSWSGATDDVGVSGYELLRDDKVVASAQASPASEGQLLPTHEYCYRVRALDAAGHRSEPSARTCVKTPAVMPIPTPRNVRAVATSQRSVSLTWDAPQPKLVYVIKWDGDMTIGTTAETAFVAAALEPGEHHCYRVEALDRDGRSSSPSAPACVATPEEEGRAEEH